MLQQQAVQHGERPALCAPERPPLSYQALWGQVQDLALRLQALGVTPASRVAVVLPNGPEMAVCFLGVAASACCAPLNPGFTEAELQFYIEDLDARVLLMSATDRGPARALATRLGLAVLEISVDPHAPAGQLRAGTVQGAGAAPAFARPDATALILHTSGTTARPKIVPLSQANLLASAANIGRHLALVPTDRCLNVMPLFHIHGLVGALLSSITQGASVVCAPGFDEAKFFGWVQALQPSWYTAVPTIHQAVLAQGARYRQVAPAHQFRFVRSSSSALPPRTFEGLRALTGAPVVEAYGMTEASHQMASNPLPPGECKAGSVGLPAGVEIALMDAQGSLLPGGATGEIVIRGAGVTQGYERNPQANAKAFENGWFRTGDQGRFDAQGYLYITGRIKEIVNRGGEKVSPREVDEALLEHPAVAQAAAFAVPHTSLGEDLAAAVVLHPQAQADEAGLRVFLFGRLAAFKVPSVIVLLDAIPKGATGKVQRTSLHVALADHLRRAFVAPSTEAERVLAGIFAAVLGTATGVHDNFFAAGGDSLKGAQVMARVNAHYGLNLPVGTLFQHPSVAQLAPALEVAAQESALLDAQLAAQIAQLSDEEVERLLADDAPPSA